MRTTVNIDEDIYRAAKSIARDRNVSIGRALSDMARKALQQQTVFTTDDELPVFAVAEDAPPITSEDVRRAEDEEQ